MIRSTRWTSTFAFAALLCASPAPCLAQEAAPSATPSSEEQGNQLFQFDVDDEPTYIRANTLTLKSKDRRFTYSGNVEVQQGDLTITSNALDGFYNENEDIERLIAKGNVIITRGDTVRATSEQATYERASETITLTESPELQQEESVLTADKITIFLNEDRSAAEGQVRVKLVDKPEGKQGQPGRKKTGAMGRK